MPARLETTTLAMDSLAALRALVLPDLALHDALGDIEDFALFAERTAEAARTRGLDLDADTVRTLLRTSPQAPPIDSLGPWPR
ncbi:MAG TPA: hypothetical protein VN157_03170, partial [Caulobacter sp.]|nr:hypothetical protein [Caulobacter sp.]